MIIAQNERPVHLPALEPQERIIAWRLTEGRLTSCRELTGALWGDRADGGALDTKGFIRLRVCSLRKALAPLGVRILNVHGQGWRVPREDIARLRDLLADEIARNVRSDRTQDRKGTGRNRRAALVVSEAAP